MAPSVPVQQASTGYALFTIICQHILGFVYLHGLGSPARCPGNADDKDKYLVPI